MNVYRSFFEYIGGFTEFDGWHRRLPDKINDCFDSAQHAQYPDWQHAISALPDCSPAEIVLDSDVIQVGLEAELDGYPQKQLNYLLQKFHPWRKGPYNLFGVEIDTEWRSDMKWRRVMPYIQPLRGKKVLDIGCGNGYHCWRMAAEHADLVVGCDPMLIYIMQYRVLRRYVKLPRVYVLPLAFEDIPKNDAAFDSVFSMGVLYHQKSPFEHLQSVRQLLKPGGEFVLETLVVDGDQNTVFTPKDRYAQMRNVWFIPSCNALSLWMRRVGFNNIQLRDISTTTPDEQRATNWMRFHSLIDFLDPEDHSKTIEGYPAPKRAIFTASH